ncbi:MAG: hypothetical protein ACFE0I_02450 [Elainellaceae cyanobacterium]
MSEKNGKVFELDEEGQLFEETEDPPKQQRQPRQPINAKRILFILGAAGLLGAGFMFLQARPSEQATSLEDVGSQSAEEVVEEPESNFQESESTEEFVSALAQAESTYLASSIEESANLIEQMQAARAAYLIRAASERAHERGGTVYAHLLSLADEQRFQLEEQLLQKAEYLGTAEDMEIMRDRVMDINAVMMAIDWYKAGDENATRLHTISPAQLALELREFQSAANTNYQASPEMRLQMQMIQESQGGDQ